MKILLSLLDKRDTKLYTTNCNIYKLCNHYWKPMWFDTWTRPHPPKSVLKQLLWYITSLLSEAISKTQSCNMISGETLTRSLMCVEIDRQVPLALILNAPIMYTRKVWKEVASHCNPMSMPTSNFQWTITNTSVIAMLFLQTWF
jgi:hypothetical protein